MFFDPKKYSGPALSGKTITLLTRAGEIILGTVKEVLFKGNEIIINWQKSTKEMYFFKIKKRRMRTFTFIENYDRLIINYPFRNFILGVTISLKDQLAFSA